MEGLGRANDFISEALDALMGQGLMISDARKSVRDVAGLYAIYATAETWRQLGLQEPSGPRPLYVGKAERSLQSRDLATHFSSGRTGQSTLRRTCAALLRDDRDCLFRGVPRNPAKPDKPSHFALAEAHDTTLTEWMNAKLTLAVWERPDNCTDLERVEIGVIRRLVPPLNIQNNASSPWIRYVRAARNRMAADVRAMM